MRRNEHHIARLLLIIVTVFAAVSVQAQVGEVNKNLEESKEKTNATDNNISSEGSSGGGFFVFLGDIFINTVGAAQMASLQNKHIYPERVSFILDTDFGSGFVNETWNFSTSARVNWGILASDLRFNSLFDNTGTLNTFDWQVLIFKIPIQSFNLEYGLGYISVPAQEQSFGSFSAGFDLKLRPVGIYLSAHYYWTTKSNLDTRFRRTFEFIGDYEFLTNNKFHMSLLVKYAYQNYFEETNFNIASLGLAIKFY